MDARWRIAETVPLYAVPPLVPTTISHAMADGTNRNEHGVASELLDLLAGAEAGVAAGCGMPRAPGAELAS